MSLNDAPAGMPEGSTGIPARQEKFPAIQE
jgi:hypothetical protein